MSLDDGKKRTEKFIFLLLFFSCAYFLHQQVEHSNTSSRYFLISAIVDYGTLNIDVYQDYTIDKSFSNGHYYSNKAIGVPLLGVPVYWVMRNMPYLRDRPPLAPLERYLIRVVTTTLPFALLGAVMFRMACLWGVGSGMALWMVMAYSFGSLAFIHAIIFSGHQVAACFAFFSFALLYQLYRQVREKVEGSNFQQMLHIFLSGFFAGISVLSDYSAILIAAALSVYVFSLPLSARLKTLFFFGGGLCVVILALYNLNCFGSPWSLSYEHLAYKKFQEGSAKGILGFSMPDPTALLYLLFSPSRGLFFIMPIFLFSLIGFVDLWKLHEFRRESILILVLVTGYLFIIAGFYGWHGGWTFGPRYLVPMLPFLALLIAFVDWEPFWFYILFGISAFQVSLAAVGLSHIPHEIQNPIIEFILPCLGYGYMALNAGRLIGMQGLWSIIPFFIIVAVLVKLLSYRVLMEKQGRGISLPWKTFMGFSIVFIILMLAIVRTKPPELVHENRSLALYYAAKATHSAQLRQMSIYEARLAEKIKKQK